MAAVFGITYPVKKGTSGALWTVVTDLTLSSKINIAVSTDASGDVDAYQWSGKEVEMKCTATYDASFSGLVGTGDILSVNGRNYLIDNVVQKQSNRDFMTVEITGRRWIGNSIPAAIP
jgi:hypothetical protein